MHSAYAGVDIGGTRIKIGLADETGRLLSCEIVDSRGFESAESFLSAITREIERQAKAASVEVKAAGVGCPGRIDFDEGRVAWLKSKLEFLDGLALADRLREKIGCPVKCDNDVNTIVAGEMRFGAGQGYNDVAGLTVGTGIGGALVLGGRMVRGKNWATGHFGYMSHDPLGPRHVCGNTGIVEEFGSQSGVVRQIQKARAAGESSPLTEMLAGGVEPGLRELFEASDGGDPLGMRLAKRLTCELGVLIANLIYALDPEVILVGGGVITHRPSLLEDIRREVALRVEYLPANATAILPMALGDAAGVLGGVALAIEAIAPTKKGPTT